MDVNPALSNLYNPAISLPSSFDQMAGVQFVFFRDVKRIKMRYSYKNTFDDHHKS